MISKHKHIWKQNWIDCPKCGLGEILECDCGETKEPVFKKKKVIYKKLCRT